MDGRIGHRSSGGIALHREVEGDAAARRDPIAGWPDRAGEHRSVRPRPPGALPARCPARRSRRVGRDRRVDRAQGQATVELALALPVLVMALLLVVQVGLVVRAQILVVHAAREGARAAAVGSAPGPAAATTPGLDPARLSVSAAGGGGPGSTVTVTVRYRAETSVPLVGGLLGDPDLQASVSMRVEGPPAAADAPTP